MILDRLENADRYFPVHKGLQAAFAFLRQQDLAGLAPGRHDIAPDWLYANVIEGEGTGVEGAKLEAHRQYIDIQYVVGHRPHQLEDHGPCTQPEGEFDTGGLHPVHRHRRCLFPSPARTRSFGTPTR